MFRVLIIILGSDRVADLGFGATKRQILRASAGHPVTLQRALR